VLSQLRATHCVIASGAAHDGGTPRARVATLSPTVPARSLNEQDFIW